MVAFQWQNEAKLIETELQSSQEECDEVKRKAEEAELLVCTKDEKINSLVLMLQEALEKENEVKEKAEALKSSLDSLRDREEKEREREREREGQRETPPKSKAGDLTTPPQGAPRPHAEESDEQSFWAKEKEQDGRTPGPDIKNGVSMSESASLAKRVLITWDRTPASSRSRARAETGRAPRTVSYSAFLMTVRTCHPHSDSVAMCADLNASNIPSLRCM